MNQINHHGRSLAHRSYRVKYTTSEFPFLDEAVALGMSDIIEVGEIRDAFRAWKESPDAFFAWSQCQAVGLKE